MFAGIRDSLLNNLATITIVLIVFIVVVSSVMMVKITKQYKSLKVKVLCYSLLGCVILSGFFVSFIIVGHYLKII